MRKLLAASGIIISFLAIFASQFGLDNDTGWGRGRIILLVLGIIFFFMGLLLQMFGSRLTEWWGRIVTTIDGFTSRLMKIVFATALSIVLVLSAYIWFVQLDKRDADGTYNYYAELAAGFKDGHLYLNDQPSAVLLGLENPYDYFLRKSEGVEDFPWDVSLYKGRFFLYWGPVPSVFLMFLGRRILSQVGDFYLALVFACGTFIYTALFLSTFWNRYLKKAPVWLLVVLLVVIGFTAPVPIMLKSAAIYDAAIFGSQFFFIGGCYWAYRSMQKDRVDIGLLFLASFHWALAVGTRVVILLPVIFSVGLTLFFVYKIFSLKMMSQRLPSLLAMGLPLVVIGFGLAYYNYARFENMLEFGVTYQLANIDYTKFHDSFSLSKIGQNLHLYFFYPVELLPRFPFLDRVEYINSNARMAGLIFIAPFIVFVIPLIRLIFGPNLHIARASLENWLYLVLAGSGLISFFVIMSFYFVEMRYLEDFMPAFVIFAAIQIGRDYELLEGKPTIRNGLTVVVLALGLITITANFLLAIPDVGVAFGRNLLNSISKLIGLR